MATYLQGVTDYIPDYQPFQPDLNFYNSVMQTKQTQYDTNWKQVNNLYAELYNTDLTHDLNLKKKDELLKQIDFNLKRVTGLDLSLQQNVDQATQVFRPFYEDKYLMKDMAWTKNYNSTMSRGLNLANSQDAKMREQYNPYSIKEMQYRREEFRESDLEATLNFGNVSYTPKVDILKTYRELAEKSGISIDIKDVDESGMYFIREKNGQKLLAPLQNLFMSAYSNDPAIQAYYATQSYVKRKDYAEQNAERFNGNKAEAEKEYLRDQYKYLKEYVAKKDEQAKDEVKVVKNKTASVQKDIENNEASVYAESYLERLQKSLAINQTVANHTEKLNNEINDQKPTSVTSPSQPDTDQLDFNNMELARLKVDAGTASLFAEQDILAAADSYAYKDYVYEKSVNPLGLENLRHRNSISRLDYASQLKMGEMQLKAQLDRETNRIKQGLADGTITYDKNGQMHEDFGDAYTIDLEDPSGLSADEINVMADNRKRYNEKVKDLTGTYIGNTLAHLNNLAQNGEVSEKELWNAVSFLDPNSKEAKERYNTKNGRQLVAKLYKQYQENPDKFVLEFSNNNQVNKLKKFMDSWSNNNAGHTIATQYNKDPSRRKVEQFTRFRDAAKLVDKENNDKISRNIINALDDQGFKYLKPETKQKIADLYIKQIKSGKTIDEDNFTDFVNKNITYERKGYATGNTQVDKQFQSLLGKEKTKEYNDFMYKQRTKFNDRNFWKSEEGQKLARQGVTADNFQNYLVKQSNKFLSENMSDADFKKVLAREVDDYNKGVRERRAAFYRKSPVTGERFSKGEFPLKEKKSPYKYTDEELAQAKKQYLSGLAKQGVGKGQLYEKVPGYRTSFEEKTGADMGDLFDVMGEAYLKTVNQTGDDGLKSYTGFVRTKGGRYALTSNKLTAKDVIMSKPGYGGFRDFQQAASDIYRIKFNQNNDKYAVTFGGLTKTATKDNRLDPAQMKQLLKDMQMSAGQKSKTKFTIARSGMAAEDPNLRAIVIKPPQEILAKYIKDAEGKTDWTKIKAIQKHGISFIAPKSEWTNDFINENELTPTEMILNAKGSIKFVNGNGAGQYIIEKAKNVPGVDYTASAKFTWINPDGSVQVKSEYLPLQKSGNNIDMVEETLATYLEETDYNNSEMIRTFQQTGNTEALAKVKTHFKVPPKGGYQY